VHQQGSTGYNYHLSHFGAQSEYGYRDIWKNWVIDQWDPNR
jgi:alpha-L-fucosidase